MNIFLELDYQLFFFINHLPHLDIFNLFFLILSGVGTAGIIWFILGILIFIKAEKKDISFIATIFLAGALSWLITEIFLKNLFARVRPSLEMGAIIVGKSNWTTDSFSMPSGHATIAWAIAIILAKKEKRYKNYFYLLAVLICISRVYLGRHFPSDVIVGGIVGATIGKIAIYILENAKIFIKNRR